MSWESTAGHDVRLNAMHDIQCPGNCRQPYSNKQTRTCGDVQVAILSIYPYIPVVKGQCNEN